MQKLKKLSLKKKIILLFFGIILLLVVISGVVFYPFAKFEDRVKQYYNKEIKDIYGDYVGWDFVTSRSPYKVLLCDFNLKNPEIGVIYTDDKNEQYTLDFYKLNRDSIFSQDWSEIKYNGGSYVSNTTFQNLVSTVKDDCNQFKKGYPTDENPRKENDDSNISWRYYAPPTEQEIERQKQEDEEITKHKQEIEKEYVTWTEYTNYIDNVYTVEKRLEMGKELGLDKEDLDFDGEAEFAKYLLEQGVFGDQKFDEEYFRGY